MAGSQRLKRMADSVQRELSELIRQELKDPRLGGLVTISAVKVSADLGYAEVYVTVMGRELYGCRKDGSEFPIEIALRPIQSDSGTVVLAVIADISTRRKIEGV